MTPEIPDPKRPGEPTLPPASDRTTPVPSSQTTPIETLYAAGPASEWRRPESGPRAPQPPAEPDPAVAASAAAPAASPAEAPQAATAGAPVGPGGARWWERRRWSGQPLSGERWSGRRTAAVAALAFVLGGVGTVAVAAVLPDSGRSASVGNRTPGVGAQLPGGQFPGAPHEHADRDGDGDGDGDGREFRGGQPPQGGLPGGQQNADGGTDSDI
ncbi:MAG TPA: hypothetical protein VFT81_05495 [Dermatophilaceae bacterium]|nr:hypothetical protein [Dermatophilaceae bacterium]